MRTVLIGSDFMYDNDGNLKPIEINTAVGWDGAEKIEVDADCLDLTSLYDFVETNGFTSIHYVGDLGMLNKALENQYTGSSIVYEFHGVGKNAITIPFIEDNDETLIIRSAYDTTALVDDTYCRDKIEFMKLIESQSFGSQFAYKRSLNILYPPTLESIQIGQYTKLNQNVFFTGVIYDSETYEVASEYRDSYVTTVNNRWLPKLLDTDLVEMADGTFKTALELEVNDLIKTIDIPNPNGTDNSSYTTNFGITYETLVSGTTYSTNKVTNLRRINLLSYINQLTFDDDSTWEDTGVSSYLIERNNEVQFENLFDVQIGDVVLLLNTTEGQVDFVRKTVTSNIQIKKVFSGWFISVENAHLFLTKTSSTNNESFVSIEHNGPSCPPYGCPCPGTCSSCPKAEPYCAYPGPYCRANSYSGFCM